MVLWPACNRPLDQFSLRDSEQNHRASSLNWCHCPGNDSTIFMLFLKFQILFKNTEKNTHKVLYSKLECCFAQPGQNSCLVNTRVHTHTQSMDVGVLIPLEFEYNILTDFVQKGSWDESDSQFGRRNVYETLEFMLEYRTCNLGNSLVVFF